MIHLLILAGWYWLMVYCFRTLLRSLFFLHSKFHQIPGINVKRPGRLQPRFLAMQVLLACELSSFEATILMMDGEGLMVNKSEGWWFIYVYLSQVHESMHAIGQQISLHSNFHRRCLQLKLLALNGFYLSLLCGVTRSRRTQARCNLRARFAQGFRRIQKISDQKLSRKQTHTSRPWCQVSPNLMLYWLYCVYISLVWRFVLGHHFVVFPCMLVDPC